MVRVCRSKYIIIIIKYNLYIKKERKTTKVPYCCSKGVGDDKQEKTPRKVSCPVSRMQETTGNEKACPQDVILVPEGVRNDDEQEETPSKGVYVEMIFFYR